MKIAYSHLIKYIKENPSIDVLSSNLFQLGHEHEIEDDIFNMEFTPNRGDCLSIKGILRDLASFYTINDIQTSYKKEIPNLSINFKNLSKEICSKISFLKIEVEELPSSYKGSINDYFNDLNVNKNNFFTDISNYLSYETGQPTHCYDASKVEGEIIFQEINKDIKFETLLDKKINLTKKNYVFTLNNEVINLAGVMGGKATACNKDTKEVLIECAYFKPEAIIGKSIRYDIQSEASHKFERGVDPDCHEAVLRRFIEIINEHSNIKSMSLVSHSYENSTIYKIPFDDNKINKIIGCNITKNEQIKYLTRLGFDIEGDLIKVPLYRSDIKTQNDIAEEIARVFGYDNIPVSEIKIPKDIKVNNNDIEKKIKLFLLDNGFYEVINSPFVGVESKNSIKVDNPLDSNREYLRTNLSDSLVSNLLFNERRQKDSIKLFEISDIYTHIKGNLKKKRRLGIIASGRVGKNYNDFSLKIDKEYMDSIFNVMFPIEKLMFNSLARDNLDTKIKSQIIFLEIDIDQVLPEIINYKNISTPPKDFIQYKKISEQPCSSRDISYAISDPKQIKYLEDTVNEFKSDLLKERFMFDYFFNKKTNIVKIAYRFVFQSKNETITDAIVQRVMNDIIQSTLKIESIEIPGLK